MRAKRTIVASLKAVGIILVVAMLIAPGAIGFLVARRFDTMLAIAMFVAVGSSVLGTFASFHLNASTGPCIVLIQAAAPTRSKLSTYQGLQDEAIALAEEINAKYGDVSPAPVRLVIRHHEPAEVFELFRAADVCIVSSLHDGMNLVAKEFIAARDDERGVLVLSHFAGASRELAEALIINPYDAYATGEALHSALTMSAAEQHERMRLMRAYVSSRNVYRWAGRMLLDASRLRKKQRIFEIAASDPTLRGR